jgi:predicted RNase H-like HicB family nuclease
MMLDNGYPAVFYDQNGSVGVVFPDLPGCVTVGRDSKDAVLRAEEALSLHLDGMIEDGEILPPPTMPVDRAEVDPEGGTVLGKIWIVPRSSRSVRVTITMDEQLLARVDQLAAEHGFTRSGYLAEAARRFMRL